MILLIDIIMLWADQVDLRHALGLLVPAVTTSPGLVFGIGGWDADFSFKHGIGAARSRANQK